MDGDGAVAFHVTSSTETCIDAFVDFDPDPELEAMGIGRLVDAPVYRLPEAWGTLRISDAEIIPATTYTVRSICAVGTESTGVDATTWLWADANNSGIPVDFDDILCVLDGFAGMFGNGCSLYSEDLEGNVPNGIIDFDDVLAALNAFAGYGYFDNPTHVDPCP